MLLKNKVEEVQTFDIFLDNTITTRESDKGCLKDYKLDYKETLVNLQGALTINLYQYQDIYLNKTNYYLVYNYTTDTKTLYIEVEE